MPIWLRNFTFQKIKAHYDAKAEAAEGDNTITANTSKSKIDKLKTASKIDQYSSKVPIKK